MASAMKKVNKISQIVRLKQVMQRWKKMSLKRRPALSCSDDDSDSSKSDSGSTVGGGGRRLTASGFLAVYVGIERRRFVIPTRFLKLPVFVALLNQAAEEFGFHINGGLVFPCEVNFFQGVLEFLERDEQRYGVLGQDEFFRLFSEMGSESCKNTANVCGHGFTPLVQKTRV